jgi:hypothetical protein
LLELRQHAEAQAALFEIGAGQSHTATPLADITNNGS